MLVGWGSAGADQDREPDLARKHKAVAVDEVGRVEDRVITAGAAAWPQCLRHGSAVVSALPEVT